MHHLSLYEIDRSYHRSEGTWHAEDDYEHNSYSKDRHVETLRVVAPSEAFAKALVESWHLTGFAEGAKVTIDAVRHVKLDGMIKQVF